MATKADFNAEEWDRIEVAEHAAEATKSGGFLGIGGTRISQEESVALDQVASTLGIERFAGGPAPADDEG